MLNCSHDYNFILMEWRLWLMWSLVCCLPVRIAMYTHIVLSDYDHIFLCSLDWGFMGNSSDFSSIVYSASNWDLKCFKLTSYPIHSIWECILTSLLFSNCFSWLVVGRRLAPSFLFLFILIHHHHYVIWLHFTVRCLSLIHTLKSCILEKLTWYSWRCDTQIYNNDRWKPQFFHKNVNWKYKNQVN